MFAVLLMSVLSKSIKPGVEQPRVWYGPVTASFETQFSGNPYDPAENDVRVHFTDERGKRIERLAYWDQGVWRADLIAPAPGEYKAVLVRNGQELVDVPGLTPTVDVETKLEHGFVHADPDHSNRFKYDDGTAYYPVGHNLGWPNPGQLSSDAQLERMHAAGLTWTRIWSAAWADRNPWWPQKDAEALPGELWAPALENWASIAHTCDLNGVLFQLVLFNHGSFSTTTDSNWADNPWNADKGGFLKSPADFFIDPEAKRRSKMWLRYAVARYASNPSLLAFELFNEVQWVDAAKAGRWSEISAWMTDMASYIRTLDPYDHMITTSSVLEPADMWKGMDYYQPHLYSKTPGADMVSTQLPGDKPGFFGEFGDDKAKATKAELRDALFGTIFANTGGAGMFWDWDAVVKDGLYPELANAAKAVKDSNLGTHPTAQKLSLTVAAGKAEGLGASDWMFARITGAPGPSTGRMLGGITTADGTYTLEILDLATGTAKTSTLAISSYKLSLDLPSGDCIVILTRQ